MSLTDYYEDQLKTLHEARGHQNHKWGSTSARNFGDEICKFLRGKKHIQSVLDFGCGQGGMKAYLMEYDVRWGEYEFVEYDPGIPGKDKLPERTFEMIISSDVLEHVEPEMIDETLQWMRDHSSRFLFHLIACDPAGIKLPDGRNVHLITEKLDWWMEKFTHPQWQWMFASDCWQQKRGYWRNHCIVQLDKVGSAPVPRKVPHE